MVEFEIPDVDYTRYSNRQLIAIPLAVLGLALVIIIGHFLITGSPVSMGIAFTGGTELRIQTADTQPQIEQTFDAEIESITPIQSSENEYILTFSPTEVNLQQQAQARVVTIRTADSPAQIRQSFETSVSNIESLGDNEYAVSFQSGELDALVEQAESAEYEVTGTKASYDVISSQERAPSFGAESKQQAIIGLVVAFGGMALLVFGLFRTFIPSIAVVASAFSDIVIPIALMNVFGIKLSLGTVAALLMLIGYSVDSDLLLNNHVLRRRGGFYDSTYRAMRTGVTMTLTSIAAMAAMTIVATLLGIDLLPSVGLILVFGLTADLMNTYLLNVSLLRYYKYEAVSQ